MAQRRERRPMIKITIVGGGTAGWLAALMLSKIRKDIELTVIESSKIGIIGAGEGTTGLFTQIIKNVIFDFGCDINEFLRDTGASFKYGIKHIDWTGDKSFYIGPLGGSPSAEHRLDYIFAKVLLDDPKNLHTITAEGQVIDRYTSTYDPFTKVMGYPGAMHFDAHKVGQYFKKIVLRDSSVNLIDDEILDANLDEQGNIESVITQNNGEVQSDFFIDCSGFKRILMKKLDVEWVSYQKNLPVNSAMPFLIPYEEGEYPDLYTTAWAQSSGWMWQIPTAERRGCGYVFCDEFINPDQAQLEIEKTLNRKIEPIRILKFETGRLEKFYHKNCLAVGLSAAFAEPLEATSIHSTIVQLVTFVFEYFRADKDLLLDPYSQKSYNKRMSTMYDDFKDFLVLHYMGGRTDSEFWRYISSGATKTEFVDSIIEISKKRMLNSRDFPHYFGSVDWGISSFVLAGTGNIPRSVLEKELVDYAPRNFDFLLAADAAYRDFCMNYKQLSDSSLSYDKFLEGIKQGNLWIS